MNQNKNIKIIKNNIEKLRPMNKNQKMKDYQKEYRINMTDKQKQKYNMNDEQTQKMKDYQKEHRKNMTDEQKQRYKEAKNKRDRDKYHNMTDEERQKYKDHKKI